MNSDTTGSANCLPAGTPIGEYRVLDVLGEGGFGIVYRALDLALDRHVALKEYMPVTLARRQHSHEVHIRSQHKGAFDAGLRSFINEARLLARFSHPALVHVYRFFEANGTAYMVMHHYQGQTLTRALQDADLQVDQAWLESVLSPVLDVVEMLHAADCFHRDIAPDNIFLQHDGNPVLLDFGAARRIISDMTQALTMVLKPGFAPIEQYVDDGAMPQGAWTDIYQLGALMFFMITRRTPPTSVARMINDPLELLTSAQAPHFSTKFLKAIHRALAVRPEDRPQSIQELRTELGLHVSVSSRLRIQNAPIAAAYASGAAPGAPSSVSPELSATKILPMAGRQAVVAEKQSKAQRATEAEIELVSIAEPVSLMSSASHTSALPGGGIREAEPPPALQPAAQSGAASTMGTQPLVRSRFNAVATLSLGLVAGLLIAGGLWWRSQAEGAAQAEAAAGRDTLAWEQARAAAGSDALRDYLSRFPDGAHRDAAEVVLAQLNTDVLRAAASSNSALEPLAATPPGSLPPVAAPDRSPLAPPAIVQPTTNTPTPAPIVLVAPAAAPLAMGRVVFNVLPWGYVSVNRAPGKASPPLTHLDLPEGTHRIDISNPGVAEPITKSVLVERGKTAVVSHRFE